MKVLRDNTFEEGFERVAASHRLQDPLSDNPLYTPGTTHISSKHFTATLGSEPPDDGHPSRWLDANDKEGAARRRKLIMHGWEDWWAYLEHGGHLMFFSERRPEQPKYKYRLLVGGTKKDGKVLSRGFGGGYGASSGGDGGWVGLFHEWGHGIRNTGGLGGGETLCDSGQLIGEPDRVVKCWFQVIKPWKNLFWGWYPGAYAWSVIGDDPNWGYTFSYAIAQLMSDNEPTPMHIIARVGEKRGLFKDGIREMGDLLGQVGARFAEFDNELQMGFRGHFAMPTRVSLTELDREKRRYRCDQKFAPEAFGVNIVRLVADKDAKEVTVDFEGHYDAKTFSDWRACIVAVDAEGKCRYSPLWNKGKMSMKVQPGDLRYWLTVTATPTALSPTTRSRNAKTHVVYQGGFGYRYPYDVTLSGCLAGSPHTTLFEDDVAGQAGMFAGRSGDGEGLISAAIPVTTPEQRKRLEETLAGLDDNAAAQWHLRNSKGKRHANGGGWVADTAEVAATAYVGPHAMVLDTAKVLDNAVIEDYVIVYGDAVFKDNARGYGKLAIENGVHSAAARMYIRNERKWSAQQVNPENDTNAPQKRLAQLTGTAAFQANYECFQPEAVLLEDHYNERSGKIYGAHRDDRIFFDGVLIGHPGFTEDGVEEGAFTFNGKDQWAELPGEMADLEVITVDMRLKVDTDKPQTLWMFGNDEQNSLSLATAGGQWVLTANAGDVSVTCQGGKVSPGAWTVVRAELDGKTMTLFQDGKMIDQIGTGFRASDAFAPGKVRRATMAAGFGGNAPMAGAVDYLRVLSEVYEDFSKIEVPLVNPRRLSAKVLARFEKKYGTYYEENRKEFVRDLAKTHPLTVYFDKYAAAISTRKEELSASAAGRVKEINAEVKAMRDKVKEMNREMHTARKNDKAYQELVAKLRPKQQELNKKMHELRMSYPGYPEALAAEQKLNRQSSELWKKAEAECKKDPKYIALEERIKEQHKKVNAAPQGSSERRELEEQRNKMHRAKREMVKQCHKALPGVRENERQRHKARWVHREKLERAMRQTEAYKQLDAEIRRLQRQMRYRPDPKLLAQRDRLDREVGRISSGIRQVKESAAAETNALEAQLLRKSGWFSGQLVNVSRKLLNGNTPHISDDIGQLESAKELQALPWPTTVGLGRTRTVRKRQKSDRPAGHATLPQTNETLDVQIKESTMKYKYLTISCVAVVAAVAVSVSFVSMGCAEKTAAAPEAGPIASMQEKEFTLPDGLDMVKIPAGKFVMGSPADEVGRREDETQRTVTISRPFYMAKQEITLNQYVPIMNPNYKPLFFRKGSWGFSLPEMHQNGPYSPGKLGADTRDLTDKPMDGISWKYAVEFCKKLTAREKAAGRLPAGYEYRLPTEAEWEYACRAGTTGAFNDPQVEKTVDAIATRQVEIIEGKAKKEDAIVNKGGVPNKFGLEDMHMGMLEWVLDDYAPYASGRRDGPGGVHRREVQSDPRRIGQLLRRPQHEGPSPWHGNRMAALCAVGLPWPPHARHALPLCELPPSPRTGHQGSHARHSRTVRHRHPQSRRHKASQIRPRRVQEGDEEVGDNELSLVSVVISRAKQCDSRTRCPTRQSLSNQNT